MIAPAAVKAAASGREVSAPTPFVPGLGWLRLSRCLHLELVEESYAGARMREIQGMLDAMESASAGHDVAVHGTELARHVAVWRRAGRQLAAKQRGGSATRHDLVSAHHPTAAAADREIVAKVPRVQVAIGAFREILLERCLGESDLALLCALLIRENNRMLLRGNYNQSSISPQWLSVAERVFFALDTAGHGVLSFFEVRSLALALVMFRDFRERAAAAATPGAWGGTAAELAEQVSHEALGLMGSFGASERGMISLQRFKALLVVRGETLESLCALDQVIQGSIAKWNQAAFGFPLPRRLWDKAVDTVGEMDRRDDELTTFLLAEGPRLMWDSEREDADFQANLATQDESEASRFAAELWRGFAAQQQRHEFARGNVVAVSLDELIRDAKAGIVLERVESFFELRSRMVDAMSHVSDNAGISEWSSAACSASVALLDSQDPVHMEDNSRRVAEEPASAAATRAEPDVAPKQPDSSQPDSSPGRVVAPVGQPLTVNVEMNGSPPSAPSTWSPPRLQLPDASSMATLEEFSGSLSSLIASADAMREMRSDGGDVAQAVTVATQMEAVAPSSGGKSHQHDVPGTKSMHRLMRELHLEQQQLEQQQQQQQQQQQRPQTRLRRRSTHLDMLDAVMSANGFVFQEVHKSSLEQSVVPPFSPGQGVRLNAPVEIRPINGNLTSPASRTCTTATAAAAARRQLQSTAAATALSRSPGSPSRRIAQILSTLPAADELGAREMCRGTLLKKGSGRGGMLPGQRNWKQRDFVASLHLPAVSVEGLASQSSPGSGRPAQALRLAFSPYIRLSYFREGGSMSTAPLGHVYLDAFTLLMDDHSSPTKSEKYPFCFCVSRPDMSGDKVVPQMDLAAVLPHDKHGRPLALPSGFPGIRHDIVLRAANATECQRWKEVLIQSIKTCQSFARAASWVGGPTPGPTSLRPKVVLPNKGSGLEGEKKLAALAPTTSIALPSTNNGGGAHSRMLSRSLARSIVDWESEMATAKQARGHPSGSLDLPPPHSPPGGSGVESWGAMVADHDRGAPNDQQIRAHANETRGHANDHVDTKTGGDTRERVGAWPQSPLGILTPGARISMASESRAPQRPEMAFGQRVGVSGSRSAHQKSKFGSSQFDKRLESPPISAVGSTAAGLTLRAQSKRVLTRAEQDALYRRLTSSPDFSPEYGNNGAVSLLQTTSRAQLTVGQRLQQQQQQQQQQQLWQSRQRQQQQQKTTPPTTVVNQSSSPSKQKRWNSVLVHNMMETQHASPGVGYNMNMNREEAVEKTMEILMRDASARGSALHPDLLRGLETLKRSEAAASSSDGILSPTIRIGEGTGGGEMPRVRMMGEAGGSFAQGENGFESLGSPGGSPSGNVVIAKRISSVPHGGGKVRRAYQRPAFS
jgi:hypothetical protein